MKTMNSDSGTETRHGPNWRHVGAFLGLTFTLTWLLDLAIALREGLNIPDIAAFQQLETLLPAFSAILLSLFFFTESPIYYRRSAGRGRWFYYYYLLLTVIYALTSLGVWLAPTQGTYTAASATLRVLIVLGLVLLIVLRIRAGGAVMARVWLTWGKLRDWCLFGAGFIAFFLLQAVLNVIFGLSGARLMLPAPPPGISLATLLVLNGVQSALLTPLLAIIIFFGEEYGWRGYLQNELTKLGRLRGVLLVGVIWGAWHWPLILLGVNYPGHPLLGLLLETLYATGIAVVLGYAVLRSGSVLLAAYLHGILDQIINFMVAIGLRPHDPALAFGIGIYGIITLAIVAFLLLRDPIWRGSGGSLPLHKLSWVSNGERSAGRV